ncbi:GT2 family glycosyltransferase [Clostridium acetobutylicum]|uniref:Glycosyltransferase domain containing protein n=1 Tax=Clostridium acetobutylicum (strain ATCC 824 / DSM 792 / JCM 1419 / IAM 19013 / LMG 5710 / NBRC 13948 / NRRL B-527 / VKM B-1787 / 2291 / W) TaxID=272562 RepID=Q97GN9_CLOAB|nr:MULTISPECIES: glycosyltransferase [Clostridium]AAK80283.1 Glycosyltransferase domain containing protein [Clostridium acetobutylicum ATCC 824]ADZ21378.1 Glycosyltransferase domain containing protein [Clostridium acetobutylicum EA 2018]AEI32282.1 glycosyltransferase domain-containing protein [Clostridium acetobutylicum DSM 1731]AWV79295.1 glycosyltransferase [Clostridium acetobutylicum]MBC2394735.1 glycosyltransferase [Clostridium acetobutylicum]
MNSYPKVSFIIVNYNGLQHLKNCFSELKNLSYPSDKIEYIVVDNGSKDGSVEFLKKNYPAVKIIKNDSNEGFAKPNDDAAKIAEGEYLALINNDMKLDKNWLNDMFETLENCNDNSYVCAGSKIVNWDGSKLDFAGGSVSFAGYGYQYDYGMDIKEANKKYNEDRDILFACGGSMLIRKDVFIEIGGFDKDYFAYYEDVDLGWRLWVLGYKVRFCSKAICYHRHNGTSKKFNQHKMKTLFERNALYTIYKNYSSDNFDIVLCNLLLMIQRIQMDLKLDEGVFDITNTEESFFEIDSDEKNFSSLVAINNLTDNLQRLNEKRQYIQRNRKVKDTDLKKLIPNPLMPFPVEYYHDYKYLDKFQRLLNTYNVEEKLDAKFRRKILLISNEPIAKKMAGPGIRYWEFAKELGKYNEVVLAIPNENQIDTSELNIEMVEYEPGNADKLIRAAHESDIIILQGLILEIIPELKDICREKILIVDIYDPFVIEILETYKNKSIKNRVEANNLNLKIQLEQLELGDYFICANDKQMDYWIGMLSALNKVNPHEYDLSYKLDKLIDLVPFGVSNEEPVNNKKMMKDKIPNLKDTDKVLIWGGGIWNWFDPITLIKAINEISKERDDIKLFFLGVKHPNPGVPEMEMCNNAIKLAEKLELKDKYVFFNMDWVEYNDRQNFLMESFAGVSCHLDNLETRFSFRTRILDYFWAKLPIIATEGDYFAELIEKDELGVVVKYGNVASLKDGILKLVSDEAFYEKCKANIAKVREEYRWKKVMKPLVKFCNDPIKKMKMDIEGTKNVIVDISEERQTSNVGQLTKGRKIGQKFICRYPNLTSIDLKVATYGRKNEHDIKFYLYEDSNNSIVAEQTIDASSLTDNSWISIKFKPIMNSQNRKFRFILEADTDDFTNCITIWKNDGEEKEDLNEYIGSIIENGKELKGSLLFKSKCVYKVNPLDKEKCVVLDEEELVSDFDISEEVMLSEGSENGDVNTIMIKKMKEINSLNKKILNLQNSLSEVKVNVNELESHVGKIDRNLNRIKNLNIFRAFKKIFRR